MSSPAFPASRLLRPLARALSAIFLPPSLGQGAPGETGRDYVLAFDPLPIGALPMAAAQIQAQARAQARGQERAQALRPTRQG